MARADGTPEIGDLGLRKKVFFEPEDGRLVITLANTDNKFTILCWGKPRAELLSDADVRFEIQQANFFKERTDRGEYLG